VIAVSGCAARASHYRHCGSVTVNEQRNGSVTEQAIEHTTRVNGFLATLHERAVS
jgi:hypothetical protein